MYRIAAKWTSALEYAVFFRSISARKRRTVLLTAGNATKLWKWQDFDQLRQQCILPGIIRNMVEYKGSSSCVVTFVRTSFNLMQRSGVLSGT